MEMSKGVSLLRTAQSLLTGRTITQVKYFQWKLVRLSVCRIFDRYNYAEQHVRGCVIRIKVGDIWKVPFYLDG